MAGSFPTPTVADAKAANLTVTKLKEESFDIILWSIPEDDLRWLCIMDSAFDTSGLQKSQHGYILGYTTSAMAKGDLARVSMISWKSRHVGVEVLEKIKLNVYRTLTC